MNLVLLPTLVQDYAAVVAVKGKQATVPPPYKVFLLSERLHRGFHPDTGCEKGKEHWGEHHAV